MEKEAKDKKYDIEFVPVEDLVPYERNAKKHDEEQINRIAESIKHFGFRQNLVIDKDNTVIIGHGRLLAAKQLAIPVVPCIRVEDLTEEQIKALRLADNKVAESGWDFGLLDTELAELTDIDMSLFGFVDEMEGINEDDLNDLFVDATRKDKEPKKIKCPHCGEWFEI